LPPSESCDHGTNLLPHWHAEPLFRIRQGHLSIEASRQLSRAVRAPDANPADAARRRPGVPDPIAV
jgi:hypothetical protein